MSSPIMRRPYQPATRWGWQDRSACTDDDQDLFFGPDGERQPERDIRETKALRTCARCPVRRNCLEQALATPEPYGVWGLTERQRAAERRRRRRLTASSEGGTAA